MAAETKRPQQNQNTKGRLYVLHDDTASVSIIASLYLILQMTFHVVPREDPV